MSRNWNSSFTGRSWPSGYRWLRNASRSFATSFGSTEIASVQLSSGPYAKPCAVARSPLSSSSATRARDSQSSASG
ncbi:hypothetical protein BW733_12355 [Tessaracoccus flavescens]|uniref:Uncharacterized protein n=1 Tax=Tessaracoccus flavescens TaxID=399497 RepID=A0A1Q2CZL7_9ACTN|nr:hypothetical protein BW733_12355 [Tessaracoccus flavescens]